MARLTFEQCCDQVAEIHGLSDWATVITHYGYVSKWVIEAAELYAKSAQAEANKELIEAYDSYVDLLNQEISSLIGLAVAHGWKSKLVEEGKQARERIRLAKEVQK